MGKWKAPISCVGTLHVDYLRNSLRMQRRARNSAFVVKEGVGPVSSVGMLEAQS